MTTSHVPTHISDIPRQSGRAVTALGFRSSQAAHRSALAHPVARRGPAWAIEYRSMIAASDVAVVLAIGAIAAAIPSGRADESTAMLPVLLMACWLLALFVYRTRDVRFVGIGLTEYRRVVNATVVAFGAFALTLHALNINIWNIQLIVLLGLGAAQLTAERWLWRSWLGRRRLEGQFLSHALVVGRKSDVEYVLRQIARNPFAGYQVDGVSVDSGSRDIRAVSDVPVVSGLEDVALAARTMNIDTVVVAGQPNSDARYIKNLSWELEGTGSELVLASRLVDVAGPRIQFRPVDGLPLVHVELPQFEGGKHLVKRGFDFIVSAIALIVLLPVFVVIGLLVRLDSPGPATFSQRRVGRDGRIFTMYKFRSMVTDAEKQLDGLMSANEGSGALFKIREDPRVTKLGRVLRRYSLDELPQLWNVLTGDMSLVGPRPPLEKEVAAYEKDVTRRLFIKPGLTGMWQVNGRSDLDWEESVRLDLYYVENWSLTGDLLILWRTVKVILKPSGAY